jgi:ribosome assembly protein YihI (activator of Der GTPase)
MPRRKPVSAKQRKAELQFKRAVKRGDIAPPSTEQSSKRKHVGRTGGARANDATSNRVAQLESRFTKLGNRVILYS